MYIFIQAVGIMAMIFPAMSFQQKTQRKILIFQVIGAALFFLHYLLLNSFVGAFLNVIAFTRAIIYSQIGKRKWAYSLFFPLLFLFLSIATYVLTFTVFNTEKTTYNLIVESLPVIGLSIQHFGFRMKDAFKVRVMYLISAPLWVAYAAFHASIGGILVDSINIVSIIIGIIRLDVRKKKDNFNTCVEKESDK